MTINPYFSFYVNAEQALNFYEEVFNTKASFVQTYGEAPFENKEDDKDKIMHAKLEINGANLMISDVLEGSANVGNMLEINLGFTDLDKQKKIFNALSSGGEITVPLEKQFWGDTFGKLTDKFGVRWMSNCEVKR